MRQRQISSVPDGPLQTAPATFFRSALTRLLQTTSSILPDEIAAPTAGSPSRVRTKPNQLRVWAGARRRRTGLSRIRAAFQTAHWATNRRSELHSPALSSTVGLHKLMGTVKYPAQATPRRSSVSRVPENGMHGLKGEIRNGLESPAPR